MKRNLDWLKQSSSAIHPPNTGARSDGWCLLLLILFAVLLAWSACSWLSGILAGRGFCSIFSCADPSIKPSLGLLQSECAHPCVLLCCVLPASLHCCPLSPCSSLLHHVGRGFFADDLQSLREAGADRVCTQCSQRRKDSTRHQGSDRDTRRHRSGRPRHCDTWQRIASGCAWPALQTSISLTIFAVMCSCCVCTAVDGVVLASEKKVPSPLVDASTVEKLSLIHI